MDKDKLELGTPAEVEARRQFLKKCGRFAVVTPPAMTVLLSVALKPTEAHASTVLGNTLNNLSKLPLLKLLGL